MMWFNKRSLHLIASNFLIEDMRSFSPQINTREQRNLSLQRKKCISCLNQEGFEWIWSITQWPLCYPYDRGHTRSFSRSLTRHMESIYGPYLYGRSDMNFEKSFNVITFYKEVLLIFLKLIMYLATLLKGIISCRSW